MKSDARLYVDQLTELFGPQDAIHKIDLVKSGLPPVCSLLYRNRPEPGLITAITYGLSLTDHSSEDDKSTMPELIVTVRSTDDGWGLAAGYVAERYRGARRFLPGQVFRLEEPLTGESEMCAFVAVDPSAGSVASTRIGLSSRSIRLVEMWPIYECEADLIEKRGIAPLQNSPQFDPKNVRRPHVFE